MVLHFFCILDAKTQVLKAPEIFILDSIRYILFFYNEGSLELTDEGKRNISKFGELIRNEITILDNSKILLAYLDEKNDDSCIAVLRCLNVIGFLRINYDIPMSEFLISPLPLIHPTNQCCAVAITFIDYFK